MGTLTVFGGGTSEVSIYEVNKVCYRTVHDPEFRAALKRDPVASLEALPLTPTERELLLKGEVGKLHDLGAHPFLLSHLSRFELFGLSVLTYSERMRAAVRQ